MRKWIITAVILVIAIIIGYNYLYQDHRDIKTENPDFVITSESLTSQFSNNLSESEKKYLNKTIEVFGSISEMNENNLTLDDVVFCQFTEPVNQSVKIKSEIKIKGRCIGYDDLLEQVKLDQCSIIK